MAKAFASQADMAEKKITFSRLSEHAYAFTAEGDPNTGIVVGDDAVMVIDTQATPKMAQTVIERIRTRHRQADQVRGAVALSRRARAGRHGLRGRSTSSAARRRAR